MTTVVQKRWLSSWYGPCSPPRQSSCCIQLQFPRQIVQWGLELQWSLWLLGAFSLKDEGPPAKPQPPSPGMGRRASIAKHLHNYRTLTRNHVRHPCLIIEALLLHLVALISYTSLKTPFKGAPVYSRKFTHAGPHTIYTHLSGPQRRLRGRRPRRRSPGSRAWKGR